MKFSHEVFLSIIYGFMKMRTKLHSVFCINKSRWVKYIFTDDKAVSACYKTTTACSLEWLLSSNYIRLHVHLPCTWRMHILALTVCTCHSLISSKYKHMSALSNVILSFRLIFFLLRNLTPDSLWSILQLVSPLVSFSLSHWFLVLTMEAAV